MNLSSIDSPSRRLTRRNGEILVSLVLVLMACISSAQTFQGDSAYQQLLREADASAIVEINGQRYVRVPQGVAGLPGGYDGAFEKRTIRLPNGQNIEVIDPGKPLQIRKNKPTQYLRLPERGMRIAAAMEKIGLSPKAELLPKAINGYRIEAYVGAKKAGKTYTLLYIHIGDEDKVRPLAQGAFDLDRGHWVADRKTKMERVKMALPVPWTGESSHHVKDDGFGVLRDGLPPISTYIVGSGTAYAVRNDVGLNVWIKRFDAKTTSVYYKRDKTSQGDTLQRRIDRSVELSIGLNTDAENWLKILAKIVDDVDRGTAVPTVASATEPKPPAPPNAKDKPKLTAQTIFGKGPVLAVKPPPKPGAGERVKNWWEGVEDYAADNPNRWAGWCLTSSGTAVMAVSLFVPGPGWTMIGAALFTCGVGAYHGGKAQPPPEVAVVAKAREQLQRYQEEWKHGFTDAELNELGIFMDDLSKLTPAQRRQVYKDADVEFTTRAEAFRQMREDEAREGRTGG